MNTPIYIWFLIFSILVGVMLFFQHGVPLYLKLLPLFLLITLGVEFAGFWMFRHYGSNMALYNFYLVFNFCFFLFVLRAIISDPFFKKLGLIVILTYGALAVFNLFYFQKLHTWNSITYSLGSLLIVAFCIYYFLELFRKPKSTKLTTEPAFWIVSGLLFFYCCSFPFLGLNNLVQHAPEVIKRNLSTILTVLNILLYLLFSIAFLCRLRPGKHTV
jgi:hypothetical protein